jgi:hypothetical protein
MEERPQETMDALMRFLGSGANGNVASSLPQMRMTPGEVRVNQTGSDNTGSSLLAGVTTKVLFGDPSKARILYHRALRPGGHHDRRAFPSWRSNGDRCIGKLELRIRGPFRRTRFEGASAGERVFRNQGVSIVSRRPATSGLGPDFWIRPNGHPVRQSRR